jgi:hypothetical protein
MDQLMRSSAAIRLSKSNSLLSFFSSVYVMFFAIFLIMKNSNYQKKTPASFTIFRKPLLTQEQPTAGNCKRLEKTVAI